MSQAPSHRPDAPDDRFRLYLDESGDHVFNQLVTPAHRYLALVGCWFQGLHYKTFHDEFYAFKQRHIPHHPDEPLILHREDILNRRGPFWRLRTPTASESFDRELLDLIARAEFRTVAIIIDKLALQKSYPTPAHPYHLSLGFMMQRYCGYLNHLNRRGDVMAEGRGGAEDRRLKESYQWHFERGAWQFSAQFFQEALTSKELKVKPKSANIAGLQLAGLLAHPVRHQILIENGHETRPLAPFANKLIQTMQPKWNRHLYNGRIEGYGWVFFPK